MVAGPASMRGTLKGALGHPLWWRTRPGQNWAVCASITSPSPPLAILPSQKGGHRPHPGLRPKSSTHHIGPAACAGSSVPNIGPQPPLHLTYPSPCLLPPHSPKLILKCTSISSLSCSAPSLAPGALRMKSRLLLMASRLLAQLVPLPLVPCSSLPGPPLNPL